MRAPRPSALHAAKACWAATNAYCCLLLLLLPCRGDSTEHEPYIHPKTLAWSRHQRRLAYAIDPNVTITLSALNFTSNPQTITVTWSGVSQPNGAFV